MKFTIVALGLALAIGGRALLGQLLPTQAHNVDLFMILLATAARTGRTRASIVTGAVAGGIEDALGEGLFGLNGFAKALLGWLMSSLQSRLVIEHPFAIAGSLALAVMANGLVVQTLLVVLGQDTTGRTLTDTLVRAGITAAAGIVVALITNHPWRERQQARNMRHLRG